MNSNTSRTYVRVIERILEEWATEERAQFNRTNRDTWAIATVAEYNRADEHIVVTSYIDEWWDLHSAVYDE